MRSFLIALTVLSACICSAFYSQHTLLSTTDSINAYLSEIPELEKAEKTSDHIECLDHALDIWKNKRPLLCLFIDHRDHDEIENALISARASAASHDEGNFAADMAVLREKLDKLRLSESTSLDGIF